MPLWRCANICSVGLDPVFVKPEATTVFIEAARQGDARTWPMSMAGLMGLPTSMTMSVRSRCQSPVKVSSSTSETAAP